MAFRSKVIRRYSLPEPLYQARLEGFRVDFYWPDARLVVEVDGKGHDEPAMQEADAIRDNLLQIADYMVLRYRHADVHRRHRRTAAQIAAMIAARVAR